MEAVDLVVVVLDFPSVAFFADVALAGVITD